METYLLLGHSHQDANAMHNTFSQFAPAGWPIVSYLSGYAILDINKRIAILLRASLKQHPTSTPSVQIDCVIQKRLATANYPDSMITVPEYNPNPLSY
jgi:hypothetical protein